MLEQKVASCRVAIVGWLPILGGHYNLSSAKNRWWLGSTSTPQFSGDLVRPDRTFTAILVELNVSDNRALNPALRVALLV